LIFRIPHLTHTPGGLICGSSKLHRPESKMCVGLSTSPYHTLWHKSYKMNNKLQFILGIIHRECLQNLLE